MQIHVRPTRGVTTYLIGVLLLVVIFICMGCKSAPPALPKPPKPTASFKSGVIAPPFERTPQTNIFPWVYPPNKDAYRWRLEARTQYVGWMPVEVLGWVDGDVQVNADASEPTRVFRMAGEAK